MFRLATISNRITARKYEDDLQTTRFRIRQESKQQDCSKSVFQNGMLQERQLDDHDDDKERSYRRLKFGDMKV